MHGMLLPIELAGRTFEPAKNTTLEHDMWFMDELSQAGIVDMEISADAITEKVAIDITTKVFRSGRMFRLLAGALVEKGQAWSLESAEKNATFFKNLSDPASKKVLQSILLVTLLSFLVSGGKYSKTSVKSLSEKILGFEPVAEAEVLEASITSESGTT